ncbi:hypothetical protein C9374_002502 [Naegleria lovaniensis]|uniref:VHS domain-containing protein n=1 Tax=Naegleria lovaniensis TaxID=51637 RepID=A0AA88GVN3_NAELO|nr:uncharacterized protein C9374_002502 [Naegleria lovaniensis]KAG2386758.1 hypothetical protein C9374_002502 [Naegleria lovaniensis]
MRKRKTSSSSSAQSSSSGSSSTMTTSINEKTKYQLNDLIHTACCKNNEFFVQDSVLQTFKSIVKQGDVYVESAYHQLMKSILPMKNSTKRYLALVFIHECMRSKTFRALLAKDFQEFIVLTVQGSPSSKKDKATSTASNGKNSIYLKRKNSKYSNYEACMPNVLPPPEKSAMLLRKKALEYIEQWSEVYGEIYPSFKKGHDYIEKVLKFQFPKLREHHLDTARIEAERKRHTQIILMQKYKKIRDEEFDEQYIHIEVCLRQLDACLDQIVPTFENMMKDALLQEEKAAEEASNNDDRGKQNNAMEHVLDSTVSDDASVADGVTEIDTEKNTTSSSEVEENIGNNSNNHVIDVKPFYFEEDENDQDENGEGNEWEEVVASDHVGGDDEMDDHTIFSNAEEMMRDIGIFSNDYEIVIDLRDIFQDNETVDNEALFEICKENLHTLRKVYLPQIKEWMRIMTSVELTEQADISIRQHMLMKCIDMKNRMNDIFQKCEKLQIESAAETALSVRKNSRRNLEEQIERARMMEHQIVQDLISQRKKKRKGASDDGDNTTSTLNAKKIKR